jgi:hypothetical protein
VEVSTDVGGWWIVGKEEKMGRMSTRGIYRDGDVMVVVVVVVAVTRLVESVHVSLCASTVTHPQPQ